MTKPNFVALAAGVVFGVGLLASGMTDPARIRGFLDVFGRWDPSLLGVMVGAIALHFVLFRLILRRGSPIFGHEFHLPTLRSINPRLVIGAAIFGVGWALAGYCPGPGIVATASGTSSSLVFVAAMAAGMLLATPRRSS
jgi:uncharacterized protein